jgi:hypothetical protein
MTDPESNHEIRKFLGLYAYYRRFISSFPDLAKPLTKRTEKPAFKMNAEMEATFQTLKEALFTAPILAYLQPGERFVVDTDAANNIGIGGVPSQVQDEQEQVIAYYNK